MSVCLNMIVKNESHVIKRCLQSVKPFIDAWVIVDTGSIDGTQDLIKEVLADIPGELHEKPWVNFEVNRTEAIELAGKKRDYLYFIDADEELILPPNWSKPLLTEKAYDLTYSFGPMTYRRPSLVSTKLTWRYVGVLHEYLECIEPAEITFLEGPKVICRPEGARSKNPTKYLDDAEILVKALEEEPNNMRYRFYLAQSFRDAGKLEDSLREYRIRAQAGGWDEEVYISKLNIARILNHFNKDAAEISRAFLEAYIVRPTRLEALVDLAVFHRNKNEWPLAYLYAKTAYELPPPMDRLFVEQSRWKAEDELAISSYYTGRFKEAFQLCTNLLHNPAVAPHELERIKNNMTLIQARL